MQAKNKILHVEEEQDYFEEFDEEDWNVNRMLDQSDTDQWNDKWEDEIDEDLSKKIRSEIDNYKDKIANK